MSAAQGATPATVAARHSPRIGGGRVIGARSQGRRSCGANARPDGGAARARVRRTAICRAAGLTVVLAAAACSRPDRPGDPNPTSLPAVRGYAVQIASVMDSSYAERLRDSLDDAGWVAYLDRADIGTRRAHHVRVQPSADPVLAGLVARGLRAGGTTADAVHEATTGPPVARAVVVRSGEAPSSRARWVFSRDRHAVLVVDDAATDSGGLRPSGFVFAADGDASALHVEGVWDVAPSPDWRHVAYGIAYLYGRPGADAPGDGDWRAFATAAGLGVGAVRREAFAATVPAGRWGIARLVVAGRASARPAPGASAELIPTVTAGPDPSLRVPAGWGVRWSAGGDTLFAGTGPSHAAKEAPPRTWWAFDSDGRALLGEARAAPPDRLAWESAPLAAGADSALGESGSRPAILGARWTLAGDGAWIRARRSGAGGPWRVVGPGHLLDATRSGAIVVALVRLPHTAAAGNAPATRQNQLIVYFLPA